MALEIDSMIAILSENKPPDYFFVRSALAGFRHVAIGHESVFRKRPHVI
jgi:hypothetical protein